MFAPFQLKKTIGEAYTMDLGDSLNTKRALASLGHLPVPEGGLDEYPDRSMLEAIRSFQRDQGLAVDGVMKPDGPTLERLNEVLAGQGTAASRPSASTMAGPPAAQPDPDSAIPVVPINLKRPVTPSTSVDLEDTARVKSMLRLLGLPQPGDDDDPYPTPDLFRGIRAFQRREGLREDGEMLPGGETEARMNALAQEKEDASGRYTGGTAAPYSSSRDRAANTQLAQAIDVGDLATLGLLGLAAGILGKKSADELQKKNDGASNPDSPKRFDTVPAEAPLPGIEPPDAELPDRTLSPAAPVELPDLSDPPVREEPTIFVLPAPEPGEFGNGIVERKGNEATRKELERIRDHFSKLGWRHVAGGRYAPDDPEVLKGNAKAGDEREEYRIPGYQGGLKGGHFTDLTFRRPDGRLAHVQSVDVDRNGKPTKRELDNAEKIRRAERHVDIYLIAKGAQLDRMRR